MGFEMRKKGRFERVEKFVEQMKEVQGEAKAVLAKALSRRPVKSWLNK